MGESKHNIMFSSSLLQDVDVDDYDDDDYDDDVVCWNVWCYIIGCDLVTKVGYFLYNCRFCSW